MSSGTRAAPKAPKKAAPKASRNVANRRGQLRSRPRPSTEEIAAFIRSVLQTSSAHRCATPAILNGRGQVLWMNASPRPDPQIDLAALEAAIARSSLFAREDEATEPMGLSFEEFAERFGMDRRTVSEHVIPVPPGPVPPNFPIGKIPGRVVGGVTRIFMTDLLAGGQQQAGEANAPRPQTASDPTGRSPWSGPIDRLRRGGAD